MGCTTTLISIITFALLVVLAIIQIVYSGCTDQRLLRYLKAEDEPGYACSTEKLTEAIDNTSKLLTMTPWERVRAAIGYTSGVAYLFFVAQVFGPWLATLSILIFLASIVIYKIFIAMTKKYLTRLTTILAAKISIKA